MSLVLSFITLITFYTYVPYQTYIKTHLVSTARSLTSVGQTAVQRILITCPMETKEKHKDLVVKELARKL